MMKVLHVITGIDRGGAENHLLDLVRHQRAEGIEVAVAYLRGDGYWVAKHGELGATVHCLGLRFYGDLRPLWRLRRLIGESSFDLVHAHLPPAELYARLALLGISSRKLPLVITKHNDCPFHRLPGERAMCRWVARRASRIIAISDAVHRYMTGPAALERSQLETVYYGIDVTPFGNIDANTVASLRREWGATDKTLVVGFAGRLVAQKSIDTLIGAFALFQHQTNCDARLVIVGEGPLEADLRRRAEEAGIAKRAVWAGFCEDIPTVMRAFDVFALTSVHEGFGMVLVEAMAARRPIVATCSGAIPEVVVDGETGLVVPVRRLVQFAAALAKLRDGALRERFGSAGYRRVAEHFTLERMWAATDAVYSRCVRAASRERPEGAKARASAA